MRRLVHELPYTVSKNQVQIREIDGGMANLTFKKMAGQANSEIENDVEPRDNTRGAYTYFLQYLQAVCYGLDRAECQVLSRRLMILHK